MQICICNLWKDILKFWNLGKRRCKWNGFGELPWAIGCCLLTPPTDVTPSTSLGVASVSMEINKLSSRLALEALALSLFPTSGLSSGVASWSLSKCVSFNLVARASLSASLLSKLTSVSRLIKALRNALIAMTTRRNRVHSWAGELEAFSGNHCPSNTA